MAITFVAAESVSGGVSSTTLSVNKPTGTAEDDVMVAIFCVPQGNTITNPSGWTTLDDQNASTGTTIRTMYKVAGASEGSSYTFTRSGAGTTKAATILTFRGVDTANPVRTSGSNGVSSTTITSPTMTGEQSTDMTVRMAGARPESSSPTNDVVAVTTGGWTAPAGGASGAPASDDFGATTASAYLLGGDSGDFTTDVTSGIASGTVVLIEGAEGGGGGDPVMPTYVSTGTAASGTGAVTPGLPSGWQENDILLVFKESVAGAGAAPTGYTQVDSTQAANTGSDTTRTALQVYWKRATASESDPSVPDGGDHTHAVMLAFRGCKTSGDPWNAVGGSTETTSDTSGSIPSVTTTVANTLVVNAIAVATDTTTARVSTWSNANLSDLTEHYDDAVSTGNGGGLSIASGGLASAGASGATSATLATSSAKAMMTIALEGVVPSGAGDSVGILLC